MSDPIVLLGWILVIPVAAFLATASAVVAKGWVLRLAVRWHRRRMRAARSAIDRAPGDRGWIIATRRFLDVSRAYFRARDRLSAWERRWGIDA